MRCFQPTSFYAQKRDASDPSFFEINPTSYYAIASIHEDIKPTDWHPGESRRPGGYCHHDDILFPTWHRQHVMFIEMLIYEAAKNIVNGDPDSPGWDVRDMSAIMSQHDGHVRRVKPIKLRNYTNFIELEKLQFPYWDWASPSTLASDVPSIFFDKTIDIETPTGKTTICNPLRAFTLPRNLGTLSLVGNESNPTQRPYKPDPRSTPFTPRGYATIRNPDSNYTSNEKLISFTIGTRSSSVFHLSIYQVLHYAKNWHQFSNHGNPLATLSDGGTGGHMIYPDAINPNAWIEDDEDFKNSDLLRNNLKTNMMEYYHPNLYLQYHWKLTLTVKKSKVGSPFKLCVFIDLPNANSSTPKSSPNFAGLVSIFARGNETLCAKCLSQPDAVVNGSVDLTTCMQRLDVNLNLTDLNNPNNGELKPEPITIVAALSDGTGIDLEDAGLVNADYWVFNEGPGHNHDYVNWTQKYI
ncbi:common central domain of tyrosinase-domain-containing protein [Gigaspora rosea]|uniref:Common central domain of tyrosinase-domain-containing protein n=1 Tax=Gigaspora rosea TaxID=44941 RepID=A0A397VPX8_9GLOM|nr:common central domain of tyrosinase-domain-containing protein [Gigaspora rosea]